MKIYNKDSFLSGLIFFALLPFLWHWDAEVWLYLAAFVLAVKNFYVAFSETESKLVETRQKHYDTVGCQLYGKYYQWKANLPWVITIAFLGTAMFLQFVVKYWLPVWVYGVFILCLIASAIYALRVQKDITEYIDSNFGIDEQMGQ